MAKTKRIPIYRRDIISDFGPIYPQKETGKHYMPSLCGRSLGGQFLIAEGEYPIITSLN